MSTEPTGFLYPFIDSGEGPSQRLLADLAVSARAKMAASAALRQTTLEACSSEVRRAGALMADRFARGGRVFAFGNGGSATDAEGTVELFRCPPAGRPLPSLSLAADPAVLTALGNDVGFDLVFSRQVIAHARPLDMVMGFSTSGDSRNVLQAFGEAARQGLLTIGLCGYDGGAMAASRAVDVCLVVRSESVHRIQEVQAALVWQLWSTVQHRLGEGGSS